MQLSFDFYQPIFMINQASKNVKVSHHSRFTANDEDLDWGLDQYDDILDFEYTTNYANI